MKLFFFSKILIPIKVVKIKLRLITNNMLLTHRYKYSNSRFYGFCSSQRQTASVGVNSQKLYNSSAHGETEIAACFKSDHASLRKNVEILAGLIWLHFALCCHQRSFIHDDISLYHLMRFRKI